MKKIVLLIAFFLVTSICFSQSLSLEASLDSLNIAASADIAGFKTDMSLNYDISKGEIESLMVSSDLTPADLFMTLELAQISGNSPENTAKIISKSKSKGWGAIAKELGIKPGSKDFKNLKNKSSDKASKLKKK